MLWQGPRGERKGKALSGAVADCVVANPQKKSRRGKGLAERSGSEQSEANPYPNPNPNSYPNPPNKKDLTSRNNKLSLFYFSHRPISRPKYWDNVV